MYGEQRFPRRVYFADRENFLRFLDKTDEFSQLLDEISVIERLFPAASAWARSHPAAVWDKRGFWSQLCLVLQHLVEHPRPGCYPRDLPIGVSGKLLGENQALICSILPIIPGPHWQPGVDYFDQLGLRRPPASFVRFRFLDADVREENHSMHPELALSADALAASPLRARRFFVTENLMTYLAFPNVPGAIVFFGEGNAVPRLERLDWLRKNSLVYWGDLDPFGFVILSRLRRRFPALESMLMDRATLDQYHALGAPGKRPEVNAIELLTASESEASRAVFDQSWSLEQEKIPQTAVHAWLYGR
jgi:hypothetical protein